MMDTVQEKKLNTNVKDLYLEKDRLESFKRLLINPDFKKVFLDHYCGSHAVSLVLNKSNPYLTAEMKEVNDEELKAIAYFSKFLQDLEVSANGIDQKIAEYNHFLETN